MVDWDLTSVAVTALARGEARPPCGAMPLEFALPDDVGALATTDPEHARDLRHGLRARLKEAFAAGHSIVDFDRKERVYLVSR